MKITAAPLHASLPEVLLLTSETYVDERGVFAEAYRSDRMAELIGVPGFVQGNVSFSHAGVLRGLHYQVTAPQGKLMRTVHGRTMNAVVDIRDGSPTFGCAVWTILNRSCLALWVPPGFANGFMALAASTVVYYECSTYYQVGSDRGVNARAPFTLLTSNGELGLIPWPHQDAIMSDKDKAAPGATAEPVPMSEWRK